MTRALVFSMLLVASACAETPRTVSVSERTCGSVSFPTRTVMRETPLELNGLAVRDATIFHVNIYVGALYLERPTRDVETFLRSRQHTRLLLHFVRDVDRDDVVRAVRWGFRNNPPEERVRFESEMLAIESMLADYARGDVVQFDYLPGDGITMRVNEIPQGVVGGDEFPPAFWNVFVGPKSGNRAMREGLVGGRCND